MDVSVVILNYNTFDLTCKCIRAVKEHSYGITYEIILVDNASTECTPRKFLDEFADIKLIANQENLGFAGGNNTGITAASGRYILLLNSDTASTNNILKILATYLDQHQRAAVVSGKLIYPNGKHQSVCQRFPSVKHKLTELFRLHKFMSRQKAGRLLLGAFFDCNENAIVDWVWGTCFMFRKELLNDLPHKKLDEQFFMYGEDIQWCMDFRKLGHEIHFCHEAIAVHYLGSSQGKSNEMIAQNHRAFLQRNYSAPKRWMISCLDRLLKTS